MGYFRWSPRTLHGFVVLALDLFAVAVSLYVGWGLTFKLTGDDSDDDGDIDEADWLNFDDCIDVGGPIAQVRPDFGQGGGAGDHGGLRISYQRRQVIPRAGPAARRRQDFRVLLVTR